MMRNSCVELLAIIDPQLTWNTLSKGRHRTPRRPRTSFIAGTKEKACTKHLNQNDSTVDRDAECNEMSVAESENVGVTVLGHHFDGSLDGFPVKKRLLLANSPSSSRGSPCSISEISDNLLDVPGSHHVNRRLGSPGLSSSAVSDSADFSGISLLAAAACSSPFNGDHLNTDATTLQDCAEIILNDVGPAKDDLSKADVSDRKAELTEMPEVLIGSSVVEDGSSTGDALISDGHTSFSDNITVVDGTVPQKVISSKRSDKLHWDLNKEMDDWEFPDDGDADFVYGSTDDVCCEDLYKNKLCLDLVGNGMGPVFLNARMPSQTLDETKSFYSTETYEDTVCKEISTRHHPSKNESDNHCKPAGVDLSHTRSEVVKPTFDKINVCLAADRVANQLVTQDGIHDPNRDPHNSTSNDNMEERSPKDEDFHSIPIEFSSCMGVSSNRTGPCVAGDKEGETETAESHSCHDCQSIEDGESSQSMGSGRGSLKSEGCNLNFHATSLCDEKELKACYDPFGLAMVTKSMNMVENITSPCDPCVSAANAVVKNHVESDLEDYSVGGCNLDAGGSSPHMEKIKHRREDDSQYEDGELRESLLHEWGMDADEDGDDEVVDYDSDGNANYIYEDSFNGPASAVHLDAESTAHMVQHSPKKYGVKSAGTVPEERLESRSQPSFQLSDVELDQGQTDFRKGRYMKRGDDFEGLERCIEMDTPRWSGSDGTGYVDHFPKVDDFKMSTSCMNQLLVGPEIVTVLEDAPYVNKLNGASDVVKNSESSKKVAKSKHPRTLLESEGDPPEFLHGKVEFFQKESRVKKVGDSYHTTEMDRVHSPFSRKYEPFNWQDQRSKGQSFDKSHCRWTQSPRDRQRHFGSDGYVSSALKNAVEAAAAKVESNGFAVAPDGTVVEPSNLDSTWMSRRNPNSASYESHSGRQLSSGRRERLSRLERDDVLAFNSQSKHIISREASPEGYINDADGTYRHRARMLSSGQKHNYSMQISGERIASFHTRTISRRYRSPSLQREMSLPRCRGRSLSRSRTRSPHAWASPDRNDSGRISDEQGFRRGNRSIPDFRPNTRVESGTLPYRSATYVNHPFEIVPSFRNHSDLPSRKIHRRNDLDKGFGRREYRFYDRLEREPPEHLQFSRSHSFDDLDPDRVDSERYHRQIDFGRHRQFTTAGKRSKYDEDDGRRGHGNSSEMLISPSSRRYETLRVKRPRRDDSDDFRLEDARVEADLQYERDAFRGYSGGCKGRFGSSHQLSNEGKGPFRYGREIRIRANPKSGVIQEHYDDANPSRRRLF